jgi:HAD superfamily hydrolase (TIGR01509 family)
LSPVATRPAAIVDVDGTLVDSNYHHALCWHRSFLDHGLTFPVWRLHRHVGMGGDKFVAAVAGDGVEHAHGDSLRERWEELFDDVIDEVQPLPGAHRFVEALKERGHTIVLATSSIERHLGVLLEKLGIRDLVDGWTMSDDVEASKPDPDLVEVALAKAGTRDAVMVGDTPWDAAAAGCAGIGTVGVLTGGFAPSELGAATAVYESVDELRKKLGSSPFA